MFIKYSALVIGVAFTIFGMWGASEWAYNLEGKISYLVLVATFVPVGVSVVPSFIEHALKGKKKRWISALSWACVLPAALAVVWFATAERQHYAKAASAAERNASHGAVLLAEAALTTAQRKLETVEADARKARGLPRKPAGKNSKPNTWCDDACLKRQDDAVIAAKKDVADARADVTRLAGQAQAEAPYSAPVWLLPAVNDALAFLGLATFFAWPAPRKTKARKGTRKRATKPKQPTTTAKAAPVKLRVVA